MCVLLDAVFLSERQENKRKRKEHKGSRKEERREGNKELCLLLFQRRSRIFFGDRANELEKKE
jgi:hypothetical protein